MLRRLSWRWAVVVPLLFAGCESSSAVVRSLTPWKQPERSPRPAPPPGYVWTDVPFSDSDAFDALLESYLTSGKPAVRVLMETASPDWSPRLNAWLGAYCDGGKVRSPAAKGGPEQLLWLPGGAQAPT